MAITNLIKVVCGECGIPFWIDADYHQKLIDNGKTFYCPNGHARAFTESHIEKVQKLERELKFHKDARKTAWNAATYQERRANGYKGAYTRQRNIVKKLKEGNSND